MDFRSGGRESKEAEQITKRKHRQEISKTVARSPDVMVAELEI